jgi:hypothetical protein
LRQRQAVAAHELRERLVDAFHDLDDASLAQHQQAGGDAAHELRNLIDSCAFARLVQRVRDRFLDARHVDDTFAQHRFGDQAELDIVRTGRLCRRGVGRRHDHSNQLLVETVFDLDERRRHAQQRAFGRLGLLRDDGLQVRGFGLHLIAQLAEAEHAKRIGDLFQQVQLRRQLIDLRAALAHEDIERVFDAAQVFLDRRGDGLHQLDRGRGQAFARLLDSIVDRQQFGQAEGGADGRHARTVGAGASDVVQQVVQQFERRRIGVARFAQLVQTFHFTVGLTEQTFDGGAAFQAAFSQRFEYRADDPPQLENSLRSRNVLELLRGTRQNF